MFVLTFFVPFLCLPFFLLAFFVPQLAIPVGVRNMINSEMFKFITSEPSEELLKRLDVADKPTETT
jgi:hypothetical protein